MRDVGDTNPLGLNREDFKSLWPRSLAVLLGQMQEVIDTVTAETRNACARSEDAAKAGTRAFVMAGKIASEARDAEHAMHQLAAEIRELVSSIPDMTHAADDVKALHELIGKLARERAELEKIKVDVEVKLGAYAQKRKALMDEAQSSLLDQLREKGLLWRLAWIFGRQVKL